LALVDLILLRLLPEKKSVGPTDLRTDLAVFFRHPPTTEQIKEAVDALKAEGFIAPNKGQRATAAGRARALQFLGLEKLPPRANWGTVKAKYLVPRALGLAPDSAEYAKAAGTGAGFAAFLLKRKLGLPDETGHTLTAVVGALICRALGHPNFTNLNALISVALGKVVGGDPIKKADAKQVLPRVLLNATRLRLDELRGAVLGGRIALDPVIDEPFDLEAFANTVKAVARKCETGRFGGYKVFINHVWNQLRDEPRFAPLGLDGFKQKLVEANQSRLMNLLPADMNQAFDANDLTASHTTQRNSTYHLIATGDEP
jgi:hypothetical protein